MRWSLAALFAGFTLLRGGTAEACAVCGCGDPTLTSFGTEKPYAGRMRAALEARYRTDHIGAANVDRIDLREGRLDASFAWAPIARLMVAATVPLVFREVGYVNLERRRTGSLGDVELRAKGFVFEDTEIRPHHLVALTAGVKLPTAPLQRENGVLLPIEVQPGTGSFDPLFGASYAFFHLPWSVYASVNGTYPTSGTEGFRASRSLRTTLAVQDQLVEAFALRVGADGRVDGRALEGGHDDPDSGGFIGFATAEALVSPGMDWLIFASLHVPVVNALDGHHVEGPLVGLGVARDF